MTSLLLKVEKITKVCTETDASWGLSALETACKSLMPEFDFHHVLTRGNWYRPGGVVDTHYQSVHQSLKEWVEEETADGDIDSLVVEYMDSGYFATRLAGKTHYLTANSGKNPEDFIQLEIEELQEVIERPLVDRDWFPDSIEDFLDPLDFPRLDPEPIGKPFFKFRRLSPVSEILAGSAVDQRSLARLRRFFRDWHQSSAYEITPFCEHWILAMREYKDSDGEQRFTAKPVSTYADKLPDLPSGESLNGVEMANAIHSYDRQLGYPFAWYFIMLGSKADNYQLAEAILKDQVGAFDYLPARDLKVLRQWEERPYGV